MLNNEKLIKDVKRIPEITEQLESIAISIEKFIGDVLDLNGENEDWTIAFQNAVNYVAKVGGGNILLPSSRDYNLRSFDEVNKCYVLIDNGAINFVGEKKYVNIIVHNETDSVFLLKRKEGSSLRNSGFEKIAINGNNKVKYCLKTDCWIDNFSLKNCRFEKATETSVDISVYLSVFDNCWFCLSPTGLKLNIYNGTYPTSNTINSCYTIQCNVGYDIYGTYSTLNSCASDFCDIAYLISGAKGIVLNGVGAENCEKVIKCNYCEGLVVNTLFMVKCGGTTTPIDYLLEFEKGVNVVISGVVNTNNNLHNYVLGLTSKNWGSENITILDGSIRNSKIYFVDNFKFKRPIKNLRDDETLKPINENISFADLSSKIKNLPTNILDNVTFNISNANYNFSDTVQIEGFSGNGVITINGNNSSIENINEYEPFIAINNSVTIIIKNFIFNNIFSHNYQSIFKLSNCKNIIFDNCIFNNSADLKRCAVSINTGSNVVFNNNCVFNGITNYRDDGTSVVTLK